MTQIVNFAKDAQGTSTYSPDFPAVCKSVLISAGDTQSFTVPSDVMDWIVAFGYVAGSSIWISINNNALPPSGGTWSTTTSTLNPSSLKVKSGQTISAYNAGSGAVGLGASFYAQP